MAVSGYEFSRFPFFDVACHANTTRRKSCMVLGSSTTINMPIADTRFDSGGWGNNIGHKTCGLFSCTSASAVMMRSQVYFCETEGSSSCICRKRRN